MVTKDYSLVLISSRWGWRRLRCRLGNRRRAFGSRSNPEMLQEFTYRSL